jgi:hypothetical protein
VLNLPIIECRTANSTLMSLEHGKHIHNDGAAGAVTHTMPQAVVGLEYMFHNVMNHYLHLKANASDVFVHNSTSSAGGTLDSLTPGTPPNDFVHVKCLKAGYWHVSTYNGTWTVT